MRIQYLLYRVCYGVISIVPPEIVDAAGATLGAFAYYLMPRRRETVAGNLQIIAAASGVHDASVKDIFISAGQNLLGSIRMSHMTAAEINSRITVEGVEHFQTGAADVGVIAVLAHMGNWEILTRLSELFLPEKECAAIYRPLENPWIDAHVKKSREQSGTRLLARREAVITSSQILKRGGVLGILCDQHAGKQGENVLFFGRPTSCTPLPVLLQKRSNAKMVFVSVVRTDLAHWHIKVRPMMSPELDTQSVMHGLEQSLLESIKNGFWLHDRWKIHGNNMFAQYLSLSAIVPYQAAIVLSNNVVVRTAAITAMRELEDIKHVWQFHLLEANDDLAYQVQELKNKIQLPLKIIIHAHNESAFFPLTKNAAPRIVGFSEKKEPALTRMIPWNGKAAEDVTTWAFLFKALGLNKNKPI